MDDQPRSFGSFLVHLVPLLLIPILSLSLIEAPLLARSTAIIASCLYLWLFELVPPFVPTLLLIFLSSIFLNVPGSDFTLANILTWGLDPVLLLFFGGFCLSAAVAKTDLDDYLVAKILGVSGSSENRLLLLSIVSAAVLSMWMSNVAAATFLLIAFKGIYSQHAIRRELKTALLLSIAFASAIGGIGTPLASGPNALAMAVLRDRLDITFLNWLLISLPLMIALLAVLFFLLKLQFKIHRRNQHTARAKFDSKSYRISFSEKKLIALAVVAMTLWLSEPLHHVSAPLVSLGLSCFLFLGGFLKADDIRAIDWSSLILISGGLILGQLTEKSGLIDQVMEFHHSLELGNSLSLILIVSLAAVMASVMSNTGTATLLIPVSLKLFPENPEFVILVAIACSLGMPFVISTPMNVAAASEGVRAGAFLRSGSVLMILGCLWIALTGPAFLIWCFS